MNLESWTQDPQQEEFREPGNILRTKTKRKVGKENRDGKAIGQKSLCFPKG